MFAPDTASSPIASRVLSTVVLSVLLQFGVLAWFLVGQGYDRATANLIPQAGVLAVPLLALLLMTGTSASSPGAARYRKAVLRMAILYVLGVLVPGLAILHLVPFTSPFDELWWIMGSVTVVCGGLAAWWAGLFRAGWIPSVLLAVILLASAFGWRAFLFSFF